MNDAYRLPLCDCADKGAYCQGRQPGKACMAHDKWYIRPCDQGKCPGPFSPACCHKDHPDAHTEEEA